MQRHVLTRKELLKEKRQSTWNRMKSMKQLYLLLAIPVVSLFIFRYLPIYGVLIAFKDYRYSDGILGSNWNNFQHFKMLFTDISFKRAFINTLLISIYKIIFAFPAPIIFALMINEVYKEKFKKVVQTISYLPHFLSWVVLSGMILELLSPQRGAVNYILTLFGIEPIYFMVSKTWFVPILIISHIWQTMGWSAIIYLASLSTIDVSMYESADIDGANRFQKAMYITLPSLVPVITILLILRLGRIMNVGFDQIFNLYNPMVYKVADVIDTFVYRVGILDARYDFSTAVGLFKNVVGITLLMATNMIVKKFNDYGIW